jgi:signal transduction histidine kinase
MLRLVSAFSRVRGCALVLALATSIPWGCQALGGSSPFVPREQPMSSACCASSDLARRRERLAAREAERAAWARKLREQTLEGLRALHGTLNKVEEAAPPAARDLIQQTISRIEAETERLRSLIAEIRPPVLDELGVGAAIEALADRTESPAVEVRTLIELGFEKGRIDLRHDEELETALYRIVQEAVGNAIQHANPSSVAVEVFEDDERGDVRIAVRDDGRGFDPSAVSGLGLSGLRERVELFGGSLEIRTSAGEGTEVQVRVPAARRSPDVAPG